MRPCVFEAWFCEDRVGDGEEGSTCRARPCAFEEHDRVRCTRAGAVSLTSTEAEGVGVHEALRGLLDRVYCTRAGTVSLNVGAHDALRGLASASAPAADLWRYGHRDIPSLRQTFLSADGQRPCIKASRS